MKPEILKEVFGDMTAYHFFVWLIFVAAVVGIIVAGVKLICKIAEKYRVDRTAHDQRVAQVRQNTEAITSLQQADVNIMSSIDKLSVKLDSLSDQITQMEKDDKAVKMHQLRDRILQAYTQHHATGEITQMEKTTLEGLIESYVNCGGNSFVMNTIQPELYTWKVLP